MKYGGRTDHPCIYIAHSERCDFAISACTCTPKFEVLVGREASRTFATMDDARAWQEKMAAMPPAARDVVIVRDRIVRCIARQERVYGDALPELRVLLRTAEEMVDGLRNADWLRGPVRRTTCVNGHPFTPENRSHGSCQICHKERQRARYLANKDAERKKGNERKARQRARRAPRTHGVGGYNNHGCRCPVCCASKREDTRARRERRKVAA